VTKLVERNGAYGGVWGSLFLKGIWSHAVGFMLLRLAAAVKLLSHFIYFRQKFYSFKAIWKDNAAINQIRLSRYAEK
jgi:hypothetical protein